MHLRNLTFSFGYIIIISQIKPMSSTHTEVIYLPKGECKYVSTLYFKREA